MMSFGLTNAPIVSMALMNKIFSPYLNQFTVVFLDGMLVYSRLIDEHEQHLRRVLQLLKDNEMYFNLKKCKFWLEQVGFLAHVISKEGLVMDPAKIKAVLN